MVETLSMKLSCVELYAIERSPRCPRQVCIIPSNVLLLHGIFVQSSCLPAPLRADCGQDGEVRLDSGQIGREGTADHLDGLTPLRAGALNQNESESA